MFLPVSKKTKNLQLAILVFAVFAVFFGVLSGGLLKWDDYQLLIEDPNLKTLSPESFFALWTRVHNMLYIPAVQSVWFTIGAIFGQWDLVALHAVNLVLHALNSVFVFLILRKLIPRDRDINGWIALLATLVFALHPARVEGVAWIAGLKEVLASTFGFGSLLTYLAFRESGKRSVWILSIVLMALSLTAKPAFVMLPFCLVVLEFKSIRDWKRIAWVTWPYFVLSLVIAVVTAMSQEPHVLLYVPPLWGRIVVGLDSLGFYLVKFIAPGGNVPDYGRMPGLLFEEPEVLWKTLPVTAVAIAILVWLRSRDLTKASLLFVLSLVPVLGLQPFFFQQISTVADRYTYFPSLWLSLVVALALAALGAKPAFQKAIGAIVLIFTVFCAVQSVLTIPKWKDDKTFFTWMLEKNPRSFNAINRLADLEREAGRFQNALDLYEASRKVASWQPYPWLYSAYVKWELGRKEEAITTLRELLAMYPGYEPAERNLKMLLNEK